MSPERKIPKVQDWPKELRGLQGLGRLARLADNGVTNTETGEWDFTKATLDDFLTLDLMNEAGMLSDGMNNDIAEELERRIKAQSLKKNTT